jgi:hypothetical protein
MRTAARAIALAAIVLQPAVAHAVCPAWPFPAYVSLRAANGRFVAAEGGGGRDLVANRTEVSNWERFKLATPDGGRLGWRRNVTLMGWGGQFVVAEPGAVLRNNRNAAGPWETFTLEGVSRKYTGDCSEVSVRLKTSSGTYVSAVAGGGGGLVSGVTTPGPAETFTMRGQPGDLDLDDASLLRSNSPGEGNASWRRLTIGDACSIYFSGDSSGIVLNLDCGRSPWRGVTVEATVFQGSELANGWHVTSFQVNRGINNVTDGITVLAHPADPPVGDIYPRQQFTAECPRGTNCGFTVMTRVRGPKRDPRF